MKQRKQEKNFQLSKETLLKGLSFFCVFISFFVINCYLLDISGITITKHFRLWFSSTFFSISWIFLFIGIIYSFRGIIQKVVHGLLYLLFLIIGYFESSAFYSNGKFFSLRELSFSFFKSLESTSENFAFCFFCSFIFVVFAWILFKKMKVKKFKFQEQTIFYLIVILLFGVCRGVAYYSLGPKIVYTSGKKSDDLKTIYLEKKQDNDSFRISGVYDFTMKEFYYVILEQLKETDQYLRK